ncbi:hypothetical protein DITRI_Ditri20bG0037800 [Diplodiscus trichospermus]
MAKLSYPALLATSSRFVYNIKQTNLFWAFVAVFWFCGFPKWLACDYCREIFALKDQNCLSDALERRTHERYSSPVEEEAFALGVRTL